MKNSISLAAATETIKRWFATKPEATSLTLEEIYKAANRELFDETTNRNWFNNKLNQLKHHSLVKATKEFDKTSKRHKTTGLELTLAGKKALGFVEDTDNETQQNQAGGPYYFSNGSLNDVARAVKEFQDKNPEFEVMFDVKFKGVQPAK